MSQNNPFLKQELSRIAEDFFGEKNVEIGINHNVKDSIDVYTSDKVELDRKDTLNPSETLENYIKIKSYRIANSPFFKEQMNEKDKMIVELKLKVDRLQEMLYTTLTTDETKLTEL